MELSQEDARFLYRATEILRVPRHGIITGYHELPYVCLGASEETNMQTTKVTGKVRVSPRLIVRPPHYEPSYDEIFGEDNVDAALVGRIFGFLGFHGKPIECTSEHLSVSHIEENIQQVLNRILDELDRQEDTTTGVFITADSRYYPISIERFISTILRDEFLA